MGNMFTTKTINYKDGQHVYHQNNSIQRSATCIGNMYTTKTTINYKDGKHVHHQTINYKDGQHVHHQNN